MNPIWLSTLIAPTLHFQHAQPTRATVPPRRHAARSPKSAARPVTEQIRTMLKRAVRRLSLLRDDAQRTSLRCPRCNSASLVSKKAHLIVFECQQCRGIWLDQERLEELNTRASHDPDISCASRLQYGEAIFNLALGHAQKTQSIPCDQILEEV